jgi:long-chain acyl-CoA synthetase
MNGATVAYYPEIRTLGDVPRVHGRLRGDRIAMRFEGRLTSYSQFDRRTAQVANGLAAEGLTQGSRVAFLGRNSDLFFELAFGALRLGAVVVPLNWRLAPPELAMILADAQAEILFVAPECRDLVDRLEMAETNMRTICMASSPLDEGYLAWRDRQRDADRPTPGAPDDVAIQLYTSGTTGRPKGVQLSHHALYAFNKLAAQCPAEFGADLDWIRWTAEDVSLVALPCFHISGCGWGIVSLYAGAMTVILGEFSNEGVIDAIRRFKVSKTVLVPTTIEMMVNDPALNSADLVSIRHYLYGAAPMPPDLMERALATFDGGLVQLYGLTETCGAVTYLPPQDHVARGDKLRSAGRPLPGVEVRIVDAASGIEATAGAVGEICLRTPAMMKGYWQQPDETRRVLDGDGWLRSGDAGWLDQDGYLFISDRVKDMVVTGGENVYPVEVEAAIYGHPDVAEVAVIGVPDPKWGEAVKALVVPRPGCAPVPETILAYARERIAGYKLPKSIDFVDSLPRNATGKVLKRELREMYRASQEPPVE